MRAVAVRLPAHQARLAAFRLPAAISQRAWRKIIGETAPSGNGDRGGVLSVKNVKTAMVLGEARGVAIAVCAEAMAAGLSSMRRGASSMAVTGVSAGAEKQQVMKMVMRLLAIGEEIQQDASDALALAICHLQQARGIARSQQQAVVIGVTI
jgi:hypothetical protein